MTQTFFKLIEKIGIESIEDYTILYKNESLDNIEKIFTKNKNVNYGVNDRFYNIVGCNKTIKLPCEYNIVFDIEDIEKHFEVKVRFESVFALGFKTIDEIPANWNVSAKVHFFNSVPVELEQLNGHKFCVTSISFWELLLHNI